MSKKRSSHDGSTEHWPWLVWLVGCIPECVLFNSHVFGAPRNETAIHHLIFERHLVSRHNESSSAHPDLPLPYPQVMANGMMTPGMPMGGVPMPVPVPLVPGVPPQGVPAMPLPSDPLNPTLLAAAPPAQQKQMLGERLFPLIQRHQVREEGGRAAAVTLQGVNVWLAHVHGTEFFFPSFFLLSWSLRA